METIATRKPWKVHDSKNRKKGWRKHSKINEIEEFLEDARHDQRIGGPVGDKPDEKLFFLDVSTEVKPKPPKIKGKARLALPLKCFRNLELSSLVNPPIKPYQLQTVAKKLKKGRKFRGAVQFTIKPIEKNNSIAKFDLWDEKRYEKDELTELGTKILSNQFAKVPSRHFQKPSLLPAVEPPHPGASYNPSYADHQALLAMANQVEEVKLKEILHLDRVLTQKFPTIDTLPTQESWIAEMSHGLFESDNESENGEDEDQEDGKEIKTWGKPIDREDRKLHSKRNFEFGLKLKAEAAASEKEMKRIKHDLNHVKQYKKELDLNAQESLKRQEKTDQLRMSALYKPKRIGSQKYVAPDLELQLTDELKGCLRHLKTEGNVMADRYKSLQRRNIIEPRNRKKFIRKYKLKKQVKRSHRAAQNEITEVLKVDKKKRRYKKKME